MLSVSVDVSSTGLTVFSGVGEWSGEKGQEGEEGGQLHGGSECGGKECRVESGRVRWSTQGVRDRGEEGEMINNEEMARWKGVFDADRGRVI